MGMSETLQVGFNNEIFKKVLTVWAENAFDQKSDYKKNF